MKNIKTTEVDEALEVCEAEVEEEEVAEEQEEVEVVVTLIIFNPLNIKKSHQTMQRRNNLTQVFFH